MTKFNQLYTIINRSFGRRENSFVREEDEGIRKKLKEFNQHYKDRSRSQVHIWQERDQTLPIFVFAPSGALYVTDLQSCDSQLHTTFWDLTYSNATQFIWRSLPTFIKRPCCNLSQLQVSSREVNGRLVLEGVLTIYWGTETTVRLAETAMIYIYDIWYMIIYLFYCDKLQVLNIGQTGRDCW